MTEFHLPLAWTQPRGGREASTLLALQLRKTSPQRQVPGWDPCPRSSLTWPSSTAGCALGQEESLAGDTASAGMLNHGVLVKAPFPF